MDKFRPAIRYGLIMGVIGIVVFLLVWATAPEMFASFQWGLTQIVLLYLALPIVILILACRDTKLNFDFFSYGNAFKAAFYTGAVSVGLSLLFTVLFTLVIDPGFQERTMDLAIENTREYLEDNESISEEQYEEIMEKTEKRMEKNKGFTGTLKQHVYGLIWYAILALLIAIVYRDKNQPQVS